MSKIIVCLKHRAETGRAPYPSEVFFFILPQETATRILNVTDKSYYVILQCNIDVYSPHRPKVYLLVNVTVHTSYRQINPKWDSAEVAPDFLIEFQAESSFFDSYPDQFGRVHHWSDKHEQRWHCTDFTDFFFCQVGIESAVSEECP